MGAAARGSARAPPGRGARIGPPPSGDVLRRIRADLLRRAAPARCKSRHHCRIVGAGLWLYPARAHRSGRTGPDRRGAELGARTGRRPRIDRTRLAMIAARLRGLPALSPRAQFVLVIALGLVAAVALFVLRPGPSGSVAFEELKLPSRADVPVAIAAARDGTIWFTLDSSTALGRLRNGQLEKVAKGVESIEPLGLAVDAEGRAWYTEAPTAGHRARIAGRHDRVVCARRRRLHGSDGSASGRTAPCGSPSTPC